MAAPTHVVINDQKHEVKLTVRECTRAIELFNMYYGSQANKIKQKYDTLLEKINLCNNQKEKQSLVTQYADKINEELNKISIPITLVYSILWRVLVKKGILFKKPFTSKRRMIKSILLDEYQDIVYFIGNNILHLSGYQRKKQ